MVKKMRKVKGRYKVCLLPLMALSILFSSGQNPVYGTESENGCAFVEEANWEAGEEDETVIGKTLSGNELSQQFDESDSSEKQSSSLEQLDWKNRSDEEITETVQQAEVEECAKWLAGMHYTDFEELIQRNTWLTKECITTEYACKSYDEATGEAQFEKGGTKTEKYYEFVLESCGLAAPSKYAMNQASYFANSSGYFYTYFQQNGVQTGSATITIKGISTSKPINGGSSSASQQKSLTVGVTLTGNYPAGFGGNFGSTTSTHADSETGTYTSIWMPFSYYKEAGYCVTIGTSGKYGSTGDLFVEEKGSKSCGDNNYAQTANHDTTMKVHIGYNAGVGTTASKNTSHAAFVVNVIPAEYSVSYQGNGATGGTTQTQSCVYGKQYQYQKNGFTKQYTLTYQSEGGSVNRSADVVSYGFKGWGSNTTTASYQETGNFSNLTTANGGSVTRYAIWNPVSVKLPSAVRTGYDFLYWKSAQGNKQADTAYIPTKSEIMTAVWQAYPYRIAFYSSKEEQSPVFTQDMVYDTEKALPLIDDLGLEKAGYRFVKWESAKGTFEDGMTVKNMTDEKNGTVNLYAVWEANATEDEDGGKKSEEDDKPKESEEGKNQPGGSNTTINIFGRTDSGKNNYGLTLKEVQELLKQIQKGSITRITIDGVEYAIVKNPDGMLEIKVVDTKGQETVTVPSAITLADQSFSVSGIADGAFRGNDTVKQVFLSAGILTIGDYAFYECDNLVKVELPDTVMRIGKYAFAKCGKLSDFRFSTGCYELGDGCFQEDRSMKKISLSGKLTKISPKCFYKCKALKEVIIGREVSAIGKSAFEGCKKLSTVKIPSDVQKIEKKAFYQCEKLKKVTIKSKSLTKVGSKAFKKCRDDMRFVVPASKKESYSVLLSGKY